MSTIGGSEFPQMIAANLAAPMMRAVSLAGAILLCGQLPAVGEETPIFQYLEIFSDAQGISHLKDGRLNWQGRVGTSNLPTLATAATPAKQIRFIRLPKGQQQDWHPAPAKQFVIVLSGMVEVETEDGQRQTGGPGSVALVGDTTGRGHRTNVVGDEEVVLAFISVP